MGNYENVVSLDIARRRKWVQMIATARESGLTLTSADIQPEYEQPARILRFPLRLVSVSPPDISS